MIKTSITDANNGKLAKIVRRSSEGHSHKSPSGLATYTLPYALERNTAISAVSEAGSNDMAVNASTAGGTPDRIHDGTDSVLWTASNITGSSWRFDSTTFAQAGTKSINGVNTKNNDQALLARSSAVPHADYTALQGWIYITNWRTSGTKEIRLKVRLSGTDISTELDLSNYILTTTQDSWQSFSIPIADFALSGTTMDEIVITIIDIGGSGRGAPNFYMDELVFSSVGAPAAPQTFYLEPRAGEITYVHGFEYSFVFPYDPTATVAGATENFTTPLLAYNSFCHLSALTNGLTVQRIQADVVQFTNVIRTNFDLLKATGHNMDFLLSDQTNTMMKISTRFAGPVELDSHTKDKYTFTVNDNLSSLTNFEIRAFATTVSEADV